VYGEEALGPSVVSKWHKRFAQGRDSLEDILVSQERAELNSRFRKLQRRLSANRSQTIAEVAATAAVEVSMSDDENMSPVTQHSVPRVLTQDQRDDRMSICSYVLTKM
jgi:hypothetical protein